VCSKLVVAGWFSANRQELTALFCINKQNPDSNCKGNCYLNKKLKETDQETQSGTTLPVKQKTSTEEVWMCEKHTLLILPTSIEISFFDNQLIAYAKGTPLKIFQPPRG
jgi:hypothetical protein